MNGFNIVVHTMLIWSLLQLQSYDQSWAARWPALPLALIETEAVQMKYILLAFFNKSTYTPLDGGHTSFWWWMTKSRREEEEMEWGGTKRDRQSVRGGSISVTLSTRGVADKPWCFITLETISYHVLSPLLLMKQHRTAASPCVCIYYLQVNVKLCFLKQQCIKRDLLQGCPTRLSVCVH